MYQHVRDFRPSVTIVDAVTNLLSVGTQNDVRAMRECALTDHGLRISDAGG
jgi:hypothetical protein